MFYFISFVYAKASENSLNSKLNLAWNHIVADNNWDASRVLYTVDKDRHICHIAGVLDGTNATNTVVFNFGGPDNGIPVPHDLVNLAAYDITNQSQLFATYYLSPNNIYYFCLPAGAKYTLNITFAWF